MIRKSVQRSSEKIMRNQESEARWRSNLIPSRFRLRHQLQLHPVIGGLDALRQADPQGFVVEVGVHVGQNGPARLEAVDPGERLAEAEVARRARVP